LRCHVISALEAPQRKSTEVYQHGHQTANTTTTTAATDKIQKRRRGQVRGQQGGVAAAGERCPCHQSFYQGQASLGTRTAGRRQSRAFGKRAES
jgi:hypothetical protein